MMMVCCLKIINDNMIDLSVDYNGEVCAWKWRYLIINDDYLIQGFFHAFKDIYENTRLQTFKY